MIVRPASDFDFAFVCAHMREHNRREAAALRGEISPARLAQDYNGLADIAYFRLACCKAHPDPRYTVTEPIALFSAYRTGADFAAVHFIATERWPEIGRAAYRFLRRVVFGEMFRLYGITRAETDAMETPGALDWLYRLGFVPGPLQAPGRNGESFRRVVWSIDGAKHPLVSVRSSLEAPAELARGPVNHRIRPAAAGDIEAPCDV